VRLKIPTPTPLEFRKNLKCALVAQYLRVPSRSNYEADDRLFLGNLLQLPPIPDTHEREEEFVCSLCPEGGLDAPDKSILFHIAGYCLHVLRKTKQTCSNCFDAVTQSDPLPAIGSLSVMKELHKGSLICITGYVFDMLVLWERCFQMLKPNILHTTNTRAVLVKNFQECSNVDVVFPTCHNILVKLQKRFAKVRLRFCCRDASRDKALKRKTIHRSSKSLAMRAAVKR